MYVFERKYFPLEWRNSFHCGTAIVAAFTWNETNVLISIQKRNTRANELRVDNTMMSSSGYNTRHYNMTIITTSRPIVFLRIRDVILSLDVSHFYQQRKHCSFLRHGRTMAGHDTPKTRSHFFVIRVICGLASRRPVQRLNSFIVINQTADHPFTGVNNFETRRARWILREHTVHGTPRIRRVIPDSFVAFLGRVSRRITTLLQ